MNFLKNVTNLYIWENSFNNQKYQIDFSETDNNEKEKIFNLINDNLHYKLYASTFKNIGGLSCIIISINLANNSNSNYLITAGVLSFICLAMVAYNENKTLESTIKIEKRILSSKKIKIKRIMNDIKK